MAVGGKPHSLSTLPSQLLPQPTAPRSLLQPRILPHRREYCRTPGAELGELFPTRVGKPLQSRRLPRGGGEQFGQFRPAKKNKNKKGANDPRGVPAQRPGAGTKRAKHCAATSASRHGTRRAEEAKT